MSALIVEQRATYRAPGTSRRYLTAHSAFLAWAKHLIFRKCDCHPADSVPCDVHARLFHRVGLRCANCLDVPLFDEPRDGARCSNCGGGRIERGPIHDSERYTLVKRRLVRWLKWRASKVAA